MAKDTISMDLAIEILQSKRTSGRGIGKYVLYDSETQDTLISTNDKEEYLEFRTEYLKNINTKKK